MATNVFDYQGQGNCDVPSRKRACERLDRLILRPRVGLLACWRREFLMERADKLAFAVVVILLVSASAAIYLFTERWLSTLPRDPAKARASKDASTESKAAWDLPTTNLGLRIELVSPRDIASALRWEIARLLRPAGFVVVSGTRSSSLGLMRGADEVGGCRQGEPCLVANITASASLANYVRDPFTAPLRSPQPPPVYSYYTRVSMSGAFRLQTANDRLFEVTFKGERDPDLRLLGAGPRQPEDAEFVETFRSSDGSTVLLKLLADAYGLDTLSRGMKAGSEAFMFFGQNPNDFENSGFSEMPLLPKYRRAILAFSSDVAVPPLIRLLGSRQREVREEAAWALATIADVRLVPCLIDETFDEYPDDKPRKDTAKKILTEITRENFSNQGEWQSWWEAKASHHPMDDEMSQVRELWSALKDLRKAGRSPADVVSLTKWPLHEKLFESVFACAGSS
jgi:hypothetical protein